MPSPRLRRFACLGLLAAALVACNRGSAPAPSSLDQPDVHLVWQGVLACADCAGIDTRLRLDRGKGAAAHYQLVEAYLDGEGAEYFREEGQWRRDGRVLTLQSDAGGLRRFRLDRAGNLQAARRDGRASDAARPLVPLPPDPS